jgi:hypothetical protein
VAFLLFPQATDRYPLPERVFIQPWGGRIRRGPSDDTMRVVDGLDKAPYDPPLSTPPYRGPVAPPAEPGPGGGFDHLPLGSRQFMQAHLFGCTRLSLNVWEAYLGRAVRWFDAETYPTLELTPLVNWPNAQSGPGFLEMGIVENEQGQLRPYCLNLDVVAHEVGHAMLFSQLGVPAPGRLSAQFLAFHEGIADIGTLLTALQFDSVVEIVLEETGGNLYARNEVNRIAELSSSEQIRIADNTVTMQDVAAISLAADGTWRDAAGLDRNAHGLAEPLTGALFDFFVDLFQDGLVSRGLIPPDGDARGWTRQEVDRSIARLDAAFRWNLRRFEPAFRSAVRDARDGVGLCIGAALEFLDADDFSFDAFAGAMVRVAGPLVGHRARNALIEDFTWRGIKPAHAPLRTEPLPARPRYVASAPLVVQLRAAACCMPGRPAPHGSGLELDRIIRKEHRAPS